MDTVVHISRCPWARVFFRVYMCVQMCMCVCYFLHRVCIFFTSLRTKLFSQVVIGSYCMYNISHWSPCLPTSKHKNVTIVVIYNVLIIKEIKHFYMFTAIWVSSFVNEVLTHVFYHHPLGKKVFCLLLIFTFRSLLINWCS